MDNLLSNIKDDRDYKIIHIENDFIDIGIMPEAGGRIYYAEDKTNNYNFFYRNHVVKPSLIGMVGDWRSGSLAWGFPHHHGPNTVKSMDYQIQLNENGSVTVWIEDTDQRHRMSVLIGYTVYPNSSRIEMKIQPMNRTPVSNSFLFWANPAVHVDTTYQVIFPPSVQFVTYHAKRDMVAWPIADSIYINYDFTGLDISKWKNTRVPSSFFSWDPKEGYFGGYNHGKEAGTVWVGNRYICPGMKYWADGNNAAGVKINKGLTDSDGQYLELMAGMYTDNQPDYSWIQPYESKFGTMVWFPVRDLGGLKYANCNGALNYEITNDRILQLRMNSTSPHNQAKVILKAKGQAIMEKAIVISPAEPYKIDLPLTSGVSEDDLEISLLDPNGQVLLSYKPFEHHPPKISKPKPLKPLPSPEAIKTVEELYLAGLRLNQFYNPSVDPMPYYQEALKRDPGDYRVNTQLGILSIKNLDWKVAENYLRTAVERITANYTRPKDGEALYYLGFALREQGRTDEAYEYFYQATWCNAWHAASYYQLAEIDCQRGDFEQAMEHIDRSLLTNSENLKAFNLKTIVLRKLNKLEAARTEASKIVNLNILDHQSRNELYILNSELGMKEQSLKNLEELSTLMRDDVQSYIELATDYGNCGFNKEAIDILTRLENKRISYPMLYYFLGYYWSKEGDKDKAFSYCQLASKMPHNYCFPYRAEEILALQNSMQLIPADPKAPYYLGNLLYELQPDKAIMEWEKSRELDGTFYIVHRNLGIAYKEAQKDNVKALASMKKALSCNENDPRLIFEIDELNDLIKVSPKEKYEFLAKYQTTAKKSSETLLRLATRSVEYGKYSEAIHILASNSIIESEGAREIQTTFLNAHTLRALEYLHKGNYNKALEDLSSDISYPMGLNGLSRRAQFNFLIGLALEKNKNKIRAEEYYRKTLDIEVDSTGNDMEFLYYHGLALQKLGKLNEAKQLFDKMLSDVQKKKEGSAFFTQFERSQNKDYQIATNHYLTGLAYEGMGEKEKAKEEFANALKLNPGHIWSKIHLDSI
jgi:tetratricopeptide (TPR) repeat protein